MFKQLADSGATPSFVAFAAGRPDYLSDAPREISEGSALSRKFLQKLRPYLQQKGITNVPAFEDRVTYKSLQLLPYLELVLEDVNKNTRDDVIQTLELAKERGIEKLALITVDVHVPRSHLLVQEIYSKRPCLRDVEARFIASDRILFGVDPKFKKIFDFAYKTGAFLTTCFFENKGVRELLAGQYTTRQKSALH